MNSKFHTYYGDAQENRAMAEEFAAMGYSYAQRRDNVIWRRRSTQIAERDKDECRRCGQKHLHLQTHHCYYRKYPDGLEAVPWDYPDKALITLCRNCHEQEEAVVSQAKWSVIDALAERGASSKDFLKLSAAVKGSAFEADIKLAIETLAWAVKRPDRFQKLIDVYLQSAEGKHKRNF